MATRLFSGQSRLPPSISDITAAPGEILSDAGRLLNVLLTAARNLGLVTVPGRA
jgi:hypothetical protein